jgi:hypothetical protein
MTTYKIKKEFTPMDFYDYVKSQGREKCAEFKNDFLTFVRFAGNVFLIYKPTDSVDNLSLSDMLSERANFRRYMIEGGFVEKEKPKHVITKAEIVDDGDWYRIRFKLNDLNWVLGYLWKDGRGLQLEGSIADKNIQTDSEGRIKIL